MTNYEIEIKSLLGDQRRAIDLVAAMKELDPNFKSRGKHKQLNHYFIKGDLRQLREKLESHLPSDKQKQFDDLTSKAKDFSVRTRWADGLVLLVIKATVDDTTSSNGTARQELETEVKLSLEELDQMLLDCGFEYQAKWSREREEYVYKALNVTVDKNAGYGYLAEFETIIHDPTKAEFAKTKIREIMTELGAEELAQDRLQRMFDYYNAHWQDYYGTDNIFTID
ncbi:MAG: CYTH domain-containing protein [Candidatus Doudnabacteria bacterium]|nr:CYTH domain-containing protein [Candidatus Doudnabacteria bacterium]